MNMRTPIILILLCLPFITIAQSKVRFSNITEFSAAFQVSKTKRTVSYTAVDGSQNSVDSEQENYKIPAPRLMTAFGIMVWDLVFIGAGAGYQFQFSEKNDGNYVPYQQHVLGFGQARLHFSKGRFRPFTDLRGGYNFTMNEKRTSLLSDDFFRWDGVFIEPAIGLGFNLGKLAMFNLSVAYHFLRTDQRDAVNFPLLWTEATTRDRQHRVLLNLGFTFK
jgi:hypothetical protein